MSPLRMKENYIKIKNMPSLTEKNVLTTKQLSQIKVKKQPSLKAISGFAFINKNKFVKGSMTLEAALILPLCMMLVLNIAGIIELLRLHGKVTWALWNVGNQMAVIGTAVPDSDTELQDWAVSYLVVNERVKKLLGEEYLESSPLRYGVLGLNYFRSEYITEQECLDIIVTYEVKNIFPFGLYTYRRMGNRYYAKCWAGYDVTKTSHVKYVYVSVNGEVFHLNPKCSYLFHDVEAIETEKIASIQGNDGKLCEACRICGDEEMGEWVYYTPEGNKYHLVPDCSAIFKNIQKISWFEGMPYRPCSRCGEEE